jgi:hypothetical protein
VTDVAPSKNVVHDEFVARPRRNAIINGNMAVWQRAVSFTSATTPKNSDDTYLMDRWVLLSDGNDIVDVTRVTTPVPVGAHSAACFDIETEDKKWGIVQIIEARDSSCFIGRTVSLQFKARMGASDTSTKLRAAVLSWSSTADTVTSDVVSSWGAEGTNPTLAANWTYENTPAALAELTDAYQTYKIEGIAIDTASTTNIAVFIWSDDITNAVGDLVYITGVQLELGSTATEFEHRPYAEELALCQRYYETKIVHFGLAWYSYMRQHAEAFAVTKRIDPTCYIYPAVTMSGTVGNVYDVTNKANIAATSSVSINGFSLDFLTPNANPRNLYAFVIAYAEL